MLKDGSASPPAAVFFDRDNTLVVGSEYLGDPDQVVLTEGAAEAVAGAKRMGFAAVTISNQSGVARGFFTENDVRAVNRRLDEMLQAQEPQAVIDRHEFCPHHPTHGVAPYRQACQCRKPRDGMLRRAANALHLDLGRSWLIGDAPRDIEAGHAAGCRTILLSVNGLSPSPAARAATRVKPDFQASSLREAIWLIAKESGKQLPPLSREEQELDELDESPLEEDAREDVLPRPEPELVEAPTADHPEDANTVPEEEDDMATAQDDPNDADRIPTREEDREEQAYGLGATPVLPRAAGAGSDPASADRIAATTAQILDDLRRQRETPREDFNFLRLLAGVIQVLALAAVVWAMIPAFDTPRLLLAVFLQLLTLTLVTASSR